MIDGGTVLKRHCVPTESIVEFNLPGANGHLHVRAWAENGKYVNQIALFFSGKAWREIHFTSAAFQIRNLEENTISSTSSIVSTSSTSCLIFAAAIREGGNPDQRR